MGAEVLIHVCDCTKRDTQPDEAAMTKPSGSNVLMGLLFVAVALMGTTVILSCWAIGRADAAEAAADAVSSTLEVHMARQEERDKRTTEILEAIQIDVKAMRDNHLHPDPS